MPLHLLLGRRPESRANEGAARHDGRFVALREAQPGSSLTLSHWDPRTSVENAMEVRKSQVRNLGVRAWNFMGLSPR
jgi:hypothetical protein